MLETTEKDAKYDKLRSAKTKSEAAKKVLRGAGYARGGGVAREKHKDLKPAKKAAGGKIDGGKPAARPDKMARGGSKPSGHHTRVNINVGAGQQEKQQAMQQGMQIGAKLAAAKLAGAGGMPGAGGAPRPMGGAPMQARPMGPPPGGAPMPPAGGGGVPPTMQARGGRTYAKGGKVGPAKVKGVVNIGEGGAGGAKGRLEKIKKYGSKPK